MYRVLLCTLAATALSGSLATAQPYVPGPYASGAYASGASAPSYGSGPYASGTYASGTYAAGAYASAPSAPRGYAAPPAARPGRTNMGGGFIEAIFGGGDAPPRAAREPQTYAVDQYGNPVAAYGGRYAAHDPAEYSRTAVDPRFRPQRVAYSGSEPPGTVIVDTRQFYLFLVEGNGTAMRYGVGVGRPGFTWSGVHTVSAKKEWPDWRPPDEMLRRQPHLPSYMAGGPQNPLGARALYLGSTLYRIHGSNEPWTIGTQVSSGCIRMRNEDVMDLYERVTVGTKVVGS
ncbi:L,D-transpeptidase [Rhodoplanes serenus]|uniref:L,D-transpeptidase n=1 Tax=Rhodoplanes serenus TaxID=200615 RepID=UPI000DACA094|nr:L,D-transpeptidase [Rhodoplanes serenus]RAI35808.1 hypothetical protein CH340_04995 [Rhodoplanes serenus]